MNTVEYTVRKGNTLFGIAQFFRTTVSKILSLNQIEDPNMIYVGQVLKIPVDTEEDTGFVYITRPGDTLWSISQRFGTTIEAILKNNCLENPNIIYPGTRLYI
jgi:LysM repeat protein